MSQRPHTVLGQLIRSARTALAALFVSGVVTVTAAHASAPPPPASPEELIRIEAAPVEIAPGGRAVARVKVTIQPGWHVNANPPALEYNIATKVDLDGSHGLTAGRARYPAGKQRKFGFEETPLCQQRDLGHKDACTEYNRAQQPFGCE